VGYRWAETQPTLLLNGLAPLAVRLDGGLRTGRDVAIGALASAPRVSLANRAPLIAAGCIMMRKCAPHTLPGGGSTPGSGALRARYWQPEHVITSSSRVQELREIRA